jgi:hypothetical protein
MKEPLPDIAICEECEWRGPVSECETGEDGDWETGYYKVDICPVCGGDIGDYTMSDERATEWEEWEKKRTVRVTGGEVKYDNFLHSVTIISDRYGGTYSKGKFTAWLCAPEEIPDMVSEGDSECGNFWREFDGTVGKGNTPNDAFDNLIEKVKAGANKEQYASRCSVCGKKYPDNPQYITFGNKELVRCGDCF